jgi:para-aminobenzoate synthetase component 1
VKKNKQVFLLDNPNLFKVQILHWMNQFEVCTFLDTHAYTSPYAVIDCIAAVHPISYISLEKVDPAALNAFIQENKGSWIFAHFNYEYHNITKPNTKTNLTGFPLAYLYTPAVTIELKEKRVTIESVHDNPQVIFDQIYALDFLSIGHPLPSTSTTINPLVHKADYIENIHKILVIKFYK